MQYWTVLAVMCITVYKNSIGNRKVININKPVKNVQGNVYLMAIGRSTSHDSGNAMYYNDTITMQRLL